MAKIKGVWEWNGQLDLQSFPGDYNEIFDMAFIIDNTACYGISLSGQDDALAFHHATGKTDFYIDGLGLPDAYKFFTIDGEQDIDDDLNNWIVENAKQRLQPTTFITYNGKTVNSVMIGESITLHTKGQMMADDIRIAVVMPTEEPGLYDAEGNTVATWSRLTNHYGMNVERDYAGDALNDNGLPANVLASNSELSAGTKLVIPGTVWQIGQNAFAGANNLTDVVILYGVSRINHFAFSNCKNLKNVTVPGSVANIGTEAFSGCESLTNATLREGVKSIGDSAFRGCPLPDIELPSGLENIGSLAFKGSRVSRVVIPRSLRRYGKGAFASCQNLQDITVEEGNEYYKSEPISSVARTERNYLVDFLGQTIVQFPGGYEGHFDIPVGMVTILDYAFYESLVFDVTIPTTLETIGEFAFACSYNFNLLGIPQTVCQIGAYAFQYCASLCGEYNDERREYVFTILGDKLEEISDGLFMGCGALVNISFENGIKFGSDVFIGCGNLHTISLASTLREIGVSIIDMVSDKLQVIFRGTQEMWEQVVVGAENENWLDKLVFWD